MFTDPALRTAWRRMVRLWRPMLGWTVLVWAAAALAVVPLTSGFVSWSLRYSDRWVVGNEELLAWLLTPAGAGYLLLFGGVWLLDALVRYAGLFQIVTDDLEGRPPNLRKTVLRLAGRVPILARLAVKLVGFTALLLLPVAGGLWLIHRTWLGDFDINYYLSAKPPDWYRALGVAAVVLVLAAAGFAYLAGRTLLALPAVLDGHAGLWPAARRSWALTRGRAGRLLRLLLVVIASWILVRLAVDAIVLAVAAQLAGWVAEVSTALWPLVLVTGAYLAGSVVLDAVIAFTGFAFVSMVLTKFYYEDTDLHVVAPAAPGIAAISAGVVRAIAPWLRFRRLVPVLLVLAAASGFATARMLERLPAPRPVIITAHRAGPPPAPENTLAALERAIAAQADFSEIDVLRTRDGVVVVTHDADLMRMARDRRRIAATDYRELRDVVQLPDDGSPAAERRLATLAEFLERARGRIRLNIELKYYGWDPLLAEAVARDVRAAGMEQEVVIMSLNLEAVRQVRLLAPEIPVGYVSSVAVGAISRLPVDFLAVNRTRVTPRLLREARARGMQLHVWTVNQPGLMADLIGLGVDGIITDRPALAVRVREELATLSPAERLLLRFRKLLLDEPEES